MADWKEIRQWLDEFSKLRNEVAHLIPMVRSTTDPRVEAVGRLIPAFWKGRYPQTDFDNLGYSADELWQALSPYWGHHPRIKRETYPTEKESTQLTYRIEKFTDKLLSLLTPSKAAPTTP